MTEQNDVKRHAGRTIPATDLAKEYEKKQVALKFILKLNWN